MRRQNTHGRVLWELASRGEMTKGILCQRIGLKQVDLDIVLADLEREGKIRKTIGKHGELISLKD